MTEALEKPTDTYTVQRRFPRVFLTSVLRELRTLEACKVIWPSGFESDIFDFGRTSASVYFPMRLGLSFSKGDVVKLGWRLGKSEPFYADCRVIRGETRLLTVELLRLSQTQYKAIDTFFTCPFIATHLQQIPAEHFAPEQMFTEWYHGPMDTNLYIWKVHKAVVRVSLELGEHVFSWDDRGLRMGPSRDSLSYPTEDYAYYCNNLSPLEMLKPRAPELKRAREFVDNIKLDSNTDTTLIFLKKVFEYGS